MKKILATIIAVVTVSSAGAVYRDDFKLADSSEVRDNIYTEILPLGKTHFLVSWIDRYDQWAMDGYIVKFKMNGVRTGNRVALIDDTLSVESPIRLAAQKNGNIVASWAYQNDRVPPYLEWATARIYDSLLNPISPEIRVDTISDTTTFRFVDVWGLETDSAGNFVTLYGINQYTPFLQRFNSEGEKIGGPINVYIPYDQDEPGGFPCEDSQYRCHPGSGWDMDMRPNGEIIIVYYGEPFHEYPQYRSAYALGRLFNADLTPKGQVFIVPCEGIPCTLDDTLLLFGSFPKVEFAENGDFVVTWNQGYDPDWTYLIGARRFNADGTPKGPPFIVNDHYPDYVFNRPRIVVGKNGEFVVFWADLDSWDPIWCNLWAQAYDSSGAPQGANYRINTPDGSLRGNDEFYDAFIMDSTFVITWQDVSRDYPPKIGWQYGQIMPFEMVGFFIPGDANLDGYVTLTDVIFLVNYIFKHQAPPYPKWAGDVNADCKVTLADVIYLVNHIFKTGWPIQQGCAQ